ncbi:hypothetical protein PUNSTDRAFT_139548 [Punctularia strigosozonata HHB-11173 SS5]|uniref:Uncharacterized protein n=1 Tax=Punctularia strigosozonata (strain HHB-11173) TaxID=741275 RepID=R7RZQ0_PUNST|nr:uncharacterized protein PUNSTDRAFT_139548 [Punctularia strigosozonata HHB-11173 SS5]EIN03458.1 hypothetical protein PUNSTDRAFT_139548 [Punctularia strigosozonata HHB-11173 SS5]
MALRRNVFVLITSDELSPTVRAFLNILKEDPKIALICHLGSFLDRDLDSQPSYEILCILQEVPPIIGKWDTEKLLQRLCEKPRDIVTSGSAREVMASLGIFDGRTVSSGNLPVGVVSSFPQIHWESDEFIRDMHIWTSDDSPKSLRNIALLLPYADDLRGQLPVSAFNEPPFWIQSPGPQTTRTESPGDRLAGLISTSPPSKQNRVILDAVQFAIRLAVEGSIDACNEIIGCLLRVFPGAPELLLDRFNVRRPLEFLWDATSQRPAFVPWQAPSAAELDGWDAAKRDGHKLPPRDEYENVLESVALRIRYGDAYLRPYTLAGAVAMATDSGDDTHALQWMDML